jgi:hypothetical protein
MAYRASILSSSKGGRKMLCFIKGIFGSMFLAGVLVMVAGEPASQPHADAIKPKITISQMPTAPPGEQLAEKNIEGSVSNAPKGSRIVIYALGDQWYLQPWTYTPFHAYSSSGKWSSETHGGYEFAIFLAKTSFKPPVTTRTLPKVGGDVLAIVRGTP